MAGHYARKCIALNTDYVRGKSVIYSKGLIRGLFSLCKKYKWEIDASFYCVTNSPCHIEYVCFRRAKTIFSGN